MGELLEVVVADPFELAGLRLTGRVVNQLADDRARLLVLLDNPVVFSAESYTHVVLAAREGESAAWPREVSGLGLTAPPTSAGDGWGTAHWRGGGLAFTGTAKVVGHK